MTSHKQAWAKGPLTRIQLEALRAVAKPNAVLWPRSDFDGVRQYAKTGDGRIHFQAPVDDAFALFQAKLIDSHGCITDAGRGALTKVEGGKDV